MIIVDPDNHTEAIKVWKERLDGKPNGARTLGAAMSKHLAPIFEPYYDMLVTYASDIPFDIPKGVNKIAVMWHNNWPPVSGISAWRKANRFLYGYDVDYYCNEKFIINLIKEGGGQAYYLPRFIDTATLPKPKKKKMIPTLWAGNRWAEFAREFEKYKKEMYPYWISHSVFGEGDREIFDVDRKDALNIINEAQKVWAIGITQLEAQYLGAEIVSYRDDILPFYDQNTIKPYLSELLRIVHQKEPKT